MPKKKRDGKFPCHETFQSDQNAAKPLLKDFAALFYKTGVTAGK
jgi:hypothetical protein